jgi:DNA-binding transcriptional regulator YdaS (Cro superfamily)
MTTTDLMRTLQQRGLTGRLIAQELGVSTMAVSQWLRGRRGGSPSRTVALWGLLVRERARHAGTWDHPEVREALRGYHARRQRALGEW